MDGCFSQTAISSSKIMVAMAKTPSFITLVAKLAYPSILFRISFVKKKLWSVAQM